MISLLAVKMIKKNLYIVGDADDKLSQIEKNSIKLIYIDPPYNTGSKFIYNDKRKSTEWLSFILPKLHHSKRVLKEDGVIFISIDDSEFASLKTLCDQIFGQKNHLGTLITRQATRSDSKHINTIHEYVLCYAKNKQKTKRFQTLRINIPSYSQVINRVSKEVKSLFKKSGQQEAQKHLNALLKHYKHVDGFSWLKNYNLVDPVGNIYFAKDLSMPGKPNTLTIPEYEIRLEPLKTRSWAGADKVKKLLDNNQVVFKEGRPYKKSLLLESKDSLMSILSFYSRQGNHDLERLGLKDIFDAPKPVEMIKLFILSVCDKDDIVLDFFSGSATTGQAVVEVNHELSFDLKFILIQLSHTIEEGSKVATILRANNLDNDIANIGILRLNKLKDKVNNFSFEVEGVNNFV